MLAVTFIIQGGEKAKELGVLKYGIKLQTQYQCDQILENYIGVHLMHEIFMQFENAAFKVKILLEYVIGM